MLPVDGQRVSYRGTHRPGMPVEGDQGIVVAAGNRASHVKMTSGSMEGSFLEIPHTALTAAQEESEDLFGEPALGFSVQASYDAHGPDAVIDRLNREGHLGSFESIAEDVISFVSQRVRSEPIIQEAISSLDTSSGDDLVAVAAFRLLSDAFGRRAR